MCRLIACKSFTKQKTGCGFKWKVYIRFQTNIYEKHFFIKPCLPACFCFM